MDSCKTCLGLDEALDRGDMALKYFSKIIKGETKHENEKHKYQDVQLKLYKRGLQSVKDHYLITISYIWKSTEMHFEGIFHSPIFTIIDSLLAIFTWPIMEGCGKFRNKEIA